MTKIRSSRLAGSWYPGDAADLSGQVDGFLAAADAALRPAGRALLAIVPHAGYSYSGEAAGRLYGLLAGPVPRRVFVFAPPHRAPVRGVALSSAAAFATPLGPVPLDTEAARRLAAEPDFEIDDHAHSDEHAVEIQLPFLQRLWPDSPPPLVPALVGALPPERRAVAARALRAEMAPDDLVIVSTDFTHYGAAYGYVPFRQDVPAALERLDSGAILKILAGDAAGLIEYHEQTGITMCGVHAAALALTGGLPAGYQAALIDYRRSADPDGDFSLSVSYASVLISSGEATDAEEADR